jgi:hypothetical protein
VAHGIGGAANEWVLDTNTSVLTEEELA